MPFSAICRTSSSWSSRPRMPPWICGCSVLTRPPMISGWPVTSSTETTSMPQPRSASAVPPVEMIVTPSATSRRAKSWRPVLSETEISARVTLTRPPRERSGPGDDPRGRGRTLPAANRRTASGTRRCSTPRIRAVSDSASSPYITGTASWRMGGPPSTTSSAKCTVTPVTRTPQASACSIACSPGKEGSSDGWRLMTRSGKRSRKAPVRMLIQPASTTRPGSSAATTLGQGAVALLALAAGQADHRSGCRAPRARSSRERRRLRADDPHDLDPPRPVHGVDEALQVGPAPRHQHDHPQHGLSHCGRRPARPRGRRPGPPGAPRAPPRAAPPPPRTCRGPC